MTRQLVYPEVYLVTCSKSGVGGAPLINTGVGVGR